MKPKDLSGQVFGMLTVVGRAEKASTWIVRCQCGAERVIKGKSFGRAKSCGCARRMPRPAHVVAAHTKHGLAGSPTYTSWSAMKQRCYNPKTTGYASYGGRGIRVCDRWRESFEAFVADVGERPSLRHSLDRYPDVDGHYEPGNVRWATTREQGRNKRNTHRAKVAGESVALIDLSEKFGLNRHAVQRRIKAGWDETVATSTPSMRRGESHRRAVLTESIVRDIRAMRAQGLAYKAIAERVGVSVSAVNHVLNGRVWRHVA